MAPPILESSCSALCCLTGSDASMQDILDKRRTQFTCQMTVTLIVNFLAQYLRAAPLSKIFAK
ncbi:uncharacterized protein FTOL_13823 [Fusarium torulosum]|uniref:Uncharacterized protein n=1 Tax=Fusarium torulosum TaxID=33205 RepID=A0AAE8MMG3_9HYPO|nr:uncharacterized protein FTOL_13823 [Fusarium torulosum]